MPTRETDPRVAAALAVVDQTARVYDRAKAAYEKAAKTAMSAALDALRVGAGPAEVARRSPFEAAYIRRKARDANIPRAEPKGGAN